jgi:hypothetical protein
LVRARQIVGISLPPDTAQAFKAEARRRRMPIRRLFQELWARYDPPPLGAETAILEQSAVKAAECKVEQNDD